MTSYCRAVLKGATLLCRRSSRAAVQRPRGRIAPRPCLLLHSSVDSVTPTQQSIDMFARAGQPTELHLFSGTDHFMFAEGNSRVHRVVSDWLEQFFPVFGAPARAAAH